MYDESKNIYVMDDLRALLTKRKVHCKSNPDAFIGKLEAYGLNYKQSDKVPNYFYLPWEWTNKEGTLCAKIFGMGQAYINYRCRYSPKESLEQLKLI